MGYLRQAKVYQYTLTFRNIEQKIAAILVLQFGMNYLGLMSRWIMAFEWTCSNAENKE